MRRRLFDRMQRYVIDPLDRFAFRLRVPPPGDALLETSGRHTGRPRITPVCDGAEGDTFWIVAQRGHDANFVRNIEANPRVRVKGSVSSTNWRTGTARVLKDDDTAERIRLLGQDNRWRRLCLEASAAFATKPLTIRIDLDPE